MKNTLYFGDCLHVMREDVADESVDLIYLDPPFNSKRLYNAFVGGAQWVAFDDTWRWSEAVDDWHELAGSVETAPAMEGLRQILGDGAMLAYLSYMGNRLVECRRALKPTGSIYLHCDPTASHYLKALMDAVFGEENFRNEIVWKRTSAHSGARRFGPVHDTIFFYTKTDRYTWNRVLQSHDEAYIKASYRNADADGRRYQTDNLTGAGTRQGESGAAWRGRNPTAKGRHWAIPRNFPGGGDVPRPVGEALDYLDRTGRIVWPKSDTGMPHFKRYLDEMEGASAQDVIVDIGPVAAHARERMGYPTQKPLALLDRLVRASSNAGDIVLDPFCGCGTTIHAAQASGRRWIGIDVSVNACKIIERRLKSVFDSLWEDVQFIGMPKTAEDARTLADLDKFRFERWAAALIDGMEPNAVQRGDKGIDGRGRLALRKGAFVDLVSQVKGGGTGAPDVQAFNGARLQAGADMGVFICFADRVTQGMRDAAASAGRFMDAPTIQIYTVEDYFEGRAPVFPRAS